MAASQNDEEEDEDEDDDFDDEEYYAEFESEYYQHTITGHDKFTGEDVELETFDMTIFQNTID